MPLVSSGCYLCKSCAGSKETHLCKNLTVQCTLRLRRLAMNPRYWGGSKDLESGKPPTVWPIRERRNWESCIDQWQAPIILCRPIVSLYKIGDSDSILT